MFPSLGVEPPNSITKNIYVNVEMANNHDNVRQTVRYNQLKACRGQIDRSEVKLEVSFI